MIATLQFSSYEDRLNYSQQIQFCFPGSEYAVVLEEWDAVDCPRRGADDAWGEGRVFTATLVNRATGERIEACYGDGAPPVPAFRVVPGS